MEVAKKNTGYDKITPASSNNLQRDNNERTEIQMRFVL